MLIYVHLVIVRGLQPSNKKFWDFAMQMLPQRLFPSMVRDPAILLSTKNTIMLDQEQAYPAFIKHQVAIVPHSDDPNEDGILVCDSHDYRNMYKSPQRELSKVVEFEDFSSDRGPCLALLDFHAMICRLLFLPTTIGQVENARAAAKNRDHSNLSESDTSEGSDVSTADK